MRFVERKRILKYNAVTIKHCMAAETKVTDAHQTQVPAALRHKFGVEPGDVVVWEETADGEVRVRFRKRRTLWDLVDLAPGAGQGDAVEAKKKAQRGEL